MAECGNQECEKQCCRDEYSDYIRDCGGTNPWLPPFTRLVITFVPRPISYLVCVIHTETFRK